MAKNTQEAEVIVTLNGTAARKAVADLTQEYEHLRKEALAAYKAGNEALGKDLDTKAKKLMKDIEITRRETKKFADVMKNLNGASLKELNSAAKQLRSEINKLTPGTQEFISKSKQLRDVNTRINQLKGSFKGLVEEEKAASLSLKSLADGFNKYFGIVTAGLAAVTGLSLAFRKAAEDAAKLDDTYADVMKTTGLLHNEVAELDKELLKIDTRTSREQLLLLARDAGKLGIQGKENILGFVRAADQIQVALGEDLGEGAIKQLGKIADVLGYTSSMGIEKALLSIGSAVNAVGQASTANEAYLVEFTQRLAGVAAQTGISAANIIGFASGLDQSAMKVEMASTAFQKFLMKLYEDPAKFAAYANLEVEKFTDLLKNDANQAIVTILKALKDQDGFASLVPIFKDMGLDGARAVSVLAAMATNINAVTEAQALANDEFEKATSVTEEYTVKNNNLNAQLEKARKEFKNASIALGQSLNPILLKSTKLTTYLIKALATYGKEIKNAIIAITALTVAIKAKNIAQGISNGLDAASVTLTKTKVVVTNLVKLAYFKLTKQTEAAAIAQAALNGAMSASVFGLVATAVSALVVVITRLVNKEKEAGDAMSYVQSVEKKVVETYADEEAKIRTLHSIVRDNNIALSQRKKALMELQEIVPDYHASLDKEGKLIEGNTVALDAYIKKLREATHWQVYQDEWQDLERQLIEVQDKIADAQKKAQEELVRNGGNATEKYTMVVDTWGGGTKMEEYYTKYGQLMRTVRTYQKEETDLLSKQEQIRGKMNQMTVSETKDLSEMEMEITAVEKKYEQLFQEAKNAYIGAPAEGVKALGALQEKMDKEIAEIRKKYTDPTITDPNSGGSGGGLDDKDSKKVFDAKIKQLEENLRKEENSLKRSLMNQEISQAEYNARMNLLTMQGLQKRIELAKQYGQDVSKYASQLLDEEIKLVGNGMEELKEQIDTAVQQSDILDPRANEEFWAEVYRKRDEIVAGLESNSLKSEYEYEMAWLEKLHQKKMLSEEQFEQAKLKTKLKYAQQYAEQLTTLTSETTNFVTSLKEYESAKLEAEYQAQLTAAGDNAEKREEIEADYEEKKLDLQKRYADTEMAINIAKTIADGATAAIKAYAEGGPYAGVALAAMIAATTAAEVATIVAQRNAIKNTSVYRNSNATNATMRMVNTEGYGDGGFTDRAASDHKVVGVVHANEYVSPAWMVRRNPVMFANMERYRKEGGHGRTGSVSRGFAEGGFTNGAPNLTGVQGGGLSEDTARELTAAIRSLVDNGVEAYMVYTNFKRFQKRDAKFRKEISQ